jgi:hypothetical protein
MDSQLLATKQAEARVALKSLQETLKQTSEIVAERVSTELASFKAKSSELTCLSPRKPSPMEALAPLTPRRRLHEKPLSSPEAFLSTLSRLNPFAWREEPSAYDVAALNEVVLAYATKPPRLLVAEYLQAVNDARIGRVQRSPQRPTVSSACWAFKKAIGSESRLHPSYSLSLSQFAAALGNCGVRRTAPRTLAPAPLPAPWAKQGLCASLTCLLLTCLRGADAAATGGASRGDLRRVCPARGPPLPPAVPRAPRLRPAARARGRHRRGAAADARPGARGLP